MLIKLEIGSVSNFGGGVTFNTYAVRPRYVDLSGRLDRNCKWFIDVFIIVLQIIFMYF